MPRFVIERDIDGASTSSATELQEIAAELGPQTASDPAAVRR